MGFKDIILIKKNTYDDFGNPVQVSSASMKCLITELKIKNDGSDKDLYVRRYDLKALVKHKNFEPYSSLLSDDTITASHGGIDYKIKSIGVIQKNGKPLYYELAMDLL